MVPVFILKYLENHLTKYLTKSPPFTNNDYLCRLDQRLIER